MIGNANPKGHTPTGQWGRGGGAGRQPRKADRKRLKKGGVHASQRLVNPTEGRRSKFSLN